MERMVADAVRSQIQSWEPVPAERALRMPLGLILLSRGWISHRELQEALAAQRRAQDGRIGEWLHRLHGISEETITKALGIQWNCTVLPSGSGGWNLRAGSFPPSCGTAMVLRRCVKARTGPCIWPGDTVQSMLLHARWNICFASPCMAAFLEDSAWDLADGDAADTTELHLPGHDGVVACIRELIEQSRPSDARLVRVHDHLWMRMWLRSRGGHPMHIRDIVLPLRSRAAEFIRSS